jgi:hypothetical protein
MKTSTLLAFIFAAVCSTSTAQAQTLEWIRQQGTSAGDYSYGVSADGLGNVYNSGTTNGNLGGTSFGAADAFLSKHDSGGALLWTRQLGTSGNDRSFEVSADGIDNVYIAGATTGILGGASAGGNDAFLSKYDASGTLLWTQQLGTVGNDAASSVSSDGSGSVYISGITSGDLGGANAGDKDAFLSKYDATGALLWTQQIGSANWDSASSVSSDGLGSVYISGKTLGDLGSANAGGEDAFLAKYDSSGDLQWTRQLGTPADDTSHGVSADHLGNVFVVGNTADPNPDAWVSKYDSLGNLLWTGQLDGAWASDGEGVSADGLGNVYISGQIYEEVNPSLGDAFVSKYDARGVLMWTQLLDISGQDLAKGVSADGLGDVFVAGFNGEPGLFADDDVFVAKYSTTNPDFNSDGILDCIDIDSLVAEIVAGTNTSTFDLTRDGVVDTADLYEWRVQGGAANLQSGNPYLVGDANLDGAVGGEDFIAWNDHKFTSVAAWCSGDFNADGTVNGQDFDLWNDNKFTSSDGVSAVPEPSTVVVLFAAVLGLAVVRRTIRDGVSFCLRDIIRCGSNIKQYPPALALQENRRKQMSKQPTFRLCSTLLTLIAFAMVIGFCRPRHVEANTLFALTAETDELFSIDTSMLDISPIGAVGTDTAAGGLAYDANSDTLYMIGGNNNNNLYTLDQVTGVATLVGNHNQAQLAGLAFDTTNNVLYGIQSTASGTENLVTIDTANGVSTVVGSTIYPINGLAFDSQRDQLLGTDDGSGDLYEIDRNDASTTLLFDGPPANAVSGLAYDSDLDRFWDLDFDGNLSSYDPNSGYTPTVQLTGLQQFAGLAYKSEPIPEPCSSLMVAIASLGALAVVRRRSCVRDPVNFPMRCFGPAAATCGISAVYLALVAVRL